MTRSQSALLFTAVAVAGGVLAAAVTYVLLADRRTGRDHRIPPRPSRDDDRVREAMRESFPASDPPAFNPGRA